MADTLGVTQETVDNLFTATKPLTTSKHYQLVSGTCKRGEALKRDGAGLAPLAATTDEVYCISTIDADASGGAVDLTYSTSCSVLGSEIVFATGTLNDFRDSFVTNTQILVEE